MGNNELFIYFKARWFFFQKNNSFSNSIWNHLTENKFKSNCRVLLDNTIRHVSANYIKFSNVTRKSILAILLYLSTHLFSYSIIIK